jgi:hypothetical protein
MLSGFSPFSTINNPTNATKPVIPDVGLDEDSESEGDTTPAAPSQSPFSTLNSGSGNQSPFSTLNGPYSGAMSKSPFSTLANPSLLNPLGPYGDPFERLRHRLFRNTDLGHASSLSLTPFNGVSLPMAPGSLSALNDPAYQSLLSPGLGGPNVVMFQQASLKALVSLMSSMAAEQS